VKPLDALTAVRGSIGLAALFAPRVVTWSLGFARPPSGELRYVLRIWGARNLAFAVATRVAPRSWLPANVAIDAADLVSGVAYARRARPGVRGVAVATVPPLVAAGLGVVSASRGDGPAEGVARTDDDPPTVRSTP
jgi:hypothetical protein